MFPALSARKVQGNTLLKKKPPKTSSLFTLRVAFRVRFQATCTPFQAFFSPQPSLPLSTFHTGFYSNAYNSVPSTHTTAKYPL